jgi:biopolymer transport protein ExbD
MAKHSIINEGAHESGEPIGAINVTSLVDVMFCLLIMFMVATPLMSPESSDIIALPAGRGEEITESQFNYSYIVVDQRGKVFLGPVALDEAEMQTVLADNVKIREDGMVFIQGDKNAPFGRIVDVLVALKEAEISQVGFVTDPDMKRLKAGEL